VAGAADFQVATNLLAPAGDASGADRTPYVIRNTHLQLATRFVDADNGVQVITNVTNTGAKTMG
jgi:hypothetical protein